MRKILPLVVALVAAVTASSANAITYGAPTTGDQYSYVGGLVTTSTRTGEQYVYCTGTLISPTVFLTAAHCNISDTTGTDEACVTFDRTLTNKSAGLPRLVPYSMRHTFASFSIAASVSLFYLARLMGSSVEQIDKTYGHMLPDSEHYLRGLLDEFDAATRARKGVELTL